MLETIDKILESASSFLWGYILIFALLGTHLYLTILLRFPQRQAGNERGMLQPARRLPAGWFSMCPG